MNNFSTKKDILIIEDCREDFEAYRRIFENRHNVTISQDLNTARQELQRKKFDLVLIDLKLPDGDGLNFITENYEFFKHDNTSVFVVSGIDNDRVKVNAFENDADEYLTKPLSLFELEARVESHFRKKASAAGIFQSKRCGNIFVNLENQKVSLLLSDVEEVVLSLSQIEYKLLLFFMSNRDQVKTRKQIIDAVWGHDFNVGERTIDTHICYLRKKLNLSQYNIRTILGSGYAFRKID